MSLDPKSVKIRGTFITNDRGKIKRKKGKVGLDELDKRLGQTKINAAGSYTLDVAADYQRLCAEVIFGGKPTEQQWRELGHWELQDLLDSGFGKILFKLFAPNINLLCKNLFRMYATVFQGLHIDVNSLEEHFFTATFYPMAYPASYIQGILEHAVQYFQKVPYISYVEPERYKQVFTIRWLDKKL